MSTTLSNLITQTRDYMDEATADRFTDAELTRYINQGLRQVQSQVQRANPDYFLRVEIATASAGTYKLAFPADILGNQLRAVWFYDNTVSASGMGYRVEPDSLENVYANIHVSGSPSSYTYHAGYVQWAPMLARTSAFRFVYAMKETPLANGSDTIWRVADEHADCIALYAAIQARGRIGADNRGLADMYKLRMSQIMDDVQTIDPIRIPQWKID